MHIEVLKFGGSTFADDDAFARIAQYIGHRLALHGGKVVVVVSAPAGMTEWLREWSGRLNENASAEAMDALLPLADIIGMGLLRIALEKQGRAVMSLSGYQLGIITDSNFSWAKIQHFDRAALDGALSRTDVVVIPGGQGVDANGCLAWLGKNSSDLTAVAVAALFGVAECEIFSDVAGIYSADPNLIDNTELLREVPYSDAINMSLSGAKMMHYNALRYAQKHQVKIVCRLNVNNYEPGTLIGIGTTSPAVITDKRSEVYTFDSIADQDKAHDLLDDANVPAIRVKSESETVSAVTCGFFDAAAFFLRNNINFTRCESRLVSVLESNGSMKRYLVPDMNLVSYSQQLHDSLYSRSDTLCV